MVDSLTINSGGNAQDDGQNPSLGSDTFDLNATSPELNVAPIIDLGKEPQLPQEGLVKPQVASPMPFVGNESPVPMQQMPEIKLDGDQPVFQAENTQLIDTIVQQATSRPSVNSDAILPELGSDVLSAAELTSLELELKENAKLAKISRTVLVGVIAIGIAMTGYFYFKVESAQQSAFQASLTIEEVSENNIQLENNYNTKIYQIITYYITEVIWEGLELVKYSQEGDNQAVAQIRSEVATKLKQISLLAQKLTVLSGPDAKTARAELVRTLPSELKGSTLESVIRNKQLHEEIANIKKLEQLSKQTDQEFVSWIESFLLGFDIPEATLVKVNRDRPLWSEIIGQIEATTREIDPNFGDKDNQFIDYSNYNFNARTGNVTVTGQIRTEDEKTFTQIANLIDAIEAHENFRGVKTRSFTKNPVREEAIDSNDNPVEVDSAYESTLKLDFIYEKHGQQEEEPKKS